MKVGVVAVGQVAPEILSQIAEGLGRIFPDTSAEVFEEPIVVPDSTFDKKRKQYDSTHLLKEINLEVSQRQPGAPVLAVIDADIYASGLNYVFGEAFTAGRVGLVSLWRLKPEFYGEDSDLSLYDLRILKESVHEVGHTLGLGHCPRSYCVMHFSNSIFDTDKKQSLLCDQCYMQAAITINNIGNTP